MMLKDTEQLANNYRANGYAVLPGFVEPVTAAGWEVRYRELPSRRVHVGRETNTMWLEHRFADPSTALDGLAYAEDFLDLVRAITGLSGFDRVRTEVWINRYRPGDQVPHHCDRAGSTQLVLCLQGLPEPEKGGELFIRDEVVPLGTGDAVLFFARGLSHGVRPIGGTVVGPSGFARVTCVIRLFPPNDSEGATI
jgi:hypothetical protein